MNQELCHYSLADYEILIEIVCVQIKKFRDALGKHGTERCSLSPAKGLDEKDLVALASLDLISRDMVPQPSPQEEKVQELVAAAKSNRFSSDDSKIGMKEGNAMVAA